jgi:2-dehydro-3-deoxygluconokinase
MATSSSGHQNSGTDVLSIGETMALLAPNDLEPLSQTPSLRVSVAGAESNVAQYLADLGHRSEWFGRVGRDPFGERVIHSLEHSGVATDSVVVDPDALTGVMFKDPDSSGSRVYYYRRDSAASRFCIEDAGVLEESRPRFVHLSGITPALSPTARRFTLAALARAGEVGALRSFDVNYRSRLWDRSEAAPLLRQLAQSADIVFVGRDEAESLWSTREPDEIRQYLGTHHHLVVKDGAVGATSYAAGSRSGTFVATPPVRVVEPTGAGDAFAAGYLSGLLSDLPADERLALGHRMAAIAMSSTQDHVAPSPTSVKERI